MANRVPPHNKEAERDLLRLVLGRPEVVPDLAVDLVPEDFYTPLHVGLWAAIVDVQQHGEAIDMITVGEALKRAGNHRGKDTSDLLVDLYADFGFTNQAPKLAEIIVNASRLRHLLRVSMDITEACYDQTKTASATVDAAEQAVLEVAMLGRRNNSAVPLAEAMQSWLKLQEELAAQGSQPGIMTNLPVLDDVLMGFRPGQLCTICSRPSIGKTMVGTHFAMHAALSGHPVLLASLEMSKEELVGRILSTESGVKRNVIRSGSFSEMDWASVQASIATLSPVPVFILDEPATSVAVLRAEARRVAARAGGLGMIIVDYLQLMTSPTGRRDNRQVEVAEISGGLKRLAREMKVPVIALAQVNRALEVREDKHPKLGDLRESGAIENDSDIVLGLYRDRWYNPTSDNEFMEIGVLKQRSGPSGEWFDFGYDDSTGAISHVVQSRKKPWNEGQ